jgi:ankyrin repeat protein
VKVLLANGADPKAVNWDLNTALDIAASGGHLGIMEALLTDPTTKPQDSLGKNQ